MGLQHHSTLEGKTVVAEAVPEALLPRFGLLPRGSEAQQAPVMGQKTQVAPHVETEDGHIERSQMAGSTQHGAIPAEHQGQIGQLGLGGQQAWEWIAGQAAGSSHHMHPLGGEIFRAALGLALGSLAAQPGNQPDPLKPHRQAPVTSAAN